ncbi:exopolysaccharide biosynthesis polyprenyl glycosylphosphotransferase [Polaribacter sp. MED152]|uniref:exopolysaccharide biosynthesis polyprenyl glycosylphosphotransferase n=1 Tax=Polaribacter sp. MED152 TaxID=313598 RepID=UPI000068C62B|nr:exopolysaccharide biosynthesis polyprenyl glycosylphosphotransferase [Polaribacter sp. MED152]EAQ43175.1 glycosyl transferase [Polaribacter sp. MED152]
MKVGYSFLIRPINITIDLVVINLIFYLIGDENYLDFIFLLYINSLWFLGAFYSDYYKIGRITGIFKLLGVILAQFFIFSLAFFSFFTLFKEGKVVNKQFVSILLIFLFLFIAKFLFYFFLKLYRKFGNNYKRIVIIGQDETTLKLITYFNSNEDLGYMNKGFFSDKSSKSKNYLGTISESFNYVIDNNIDQIYCSTSSISRTLIKNIIWFAKINQKEIKLIPSAKDILSENISIEKYDTIPVLKIKKLPFESAQIRFLKRSFDIFFSFLICVFVLSWVTPLIWVFIKLESKNQPLFFKQKRTGFQGKDFYCYKFSSMITNKESNTQQAIKGDKRVTKVGAFIRATSLDELPQFINVLMGDMSVVGPRPHMTKQSLDFEDKIQNYIRRSAVKPGITGLAQVKGYRGEIIKKSDIGNRVRLDVFYIENWTFILDIKIIFQTLIQVLKGDEKAY